MHCVLREENFSEKKRRGDDSWREGSLSRGVGMDKGTETSCMARVDTGRLRERGQPFFFSFGALSVDGQLNLCATEMKP